MRSKWQLPLSDAHAGPSDPICTSVGDSANQRFARDIIDYDGNDGFSAYRDGTQTTGDFISNSALVGRGLKRGNGRFNLGQLPSRHLRIRKANDYWDTSWRHDYTPMPAYARHCSFSGAALMWR